MEDDVVAALRIVMDVVERVLAESASRELYNGGDKWRGVGCSVDRNVMHGGRWQPMRWRTGGALEG